MEEVGGRKEGRRGRRAGGRGEGKKFFPVDYSDNDCDKK